MLNRPHIEFIHAQSLPWQRIPPGAARPDAEYKFLSRDPDDGACSCLIRFPAGWRRDADECLLADEEFYVIEGEILLDGQRFGPDTYAFLPAGWPRHHMQVPKGAVMLAFYSQRLDTAPLLPEATLPSIMARAIPFMDVLHMPWDRTVNDANLAHLGISRKNLRTDTVTGERTFLSLVLPHSEPLGQQGPTEKHPTVEEAYVIAGTTVGPHGSMYPGAYFWRPPGIEHGPFGTRWGCVTLIRFVGGRHVNVWSEAQAPFSFNAPYQPVLPAELAYLASTPWTPPGIY
jgi:hypothetical protein